jgi:REP element-mobilizing transposase RayT/GNAT superfamily N-acetyltransferase
MEFRHKNIRLPVDRYRGGSWFFITFCCENRRPVFTESECCEWFLHSLATISGGCGFAVHAFCLMPDHIHLLAEGLDSSSDLLKFLKSLKQRTGFQYKQKTGRQLWQKKSYDRILRHGDSPDSVAWYIWMNPIRGGICGSPRDYAWSGSLTGEGPHAALSAKYWTPPWKTEKRPPEGGRYVNKSSPQDESVSVRDAVSDDIFALVRLINAAFVVERFVFDGDRITAEETRAFMDTGKFLLAEDTVGLAGCVYVELRNGRGYLGLLAVDPEHQGTGLARKLVAAAEDYFRGEGCCAVDLRVISQRTPLPPFYRRLGYVEIGTAPFAPSLQAKVPGHYIVMSKPLA